jgi:hypothetical protein
VDPLPHLLHEPVHHRRFEEHALAADAEPFRLQPLQYLSMVDLQAHLLKNPLRLLVHAARLIGRDQRLASKA